MTPQLRLIDELNALHADYVAAINTAIEADDPAQAADLAADYDRDAIMLMAEREGRQDLLAHFGLDEHGRRLIEHPTPLRDLVKRVAALASSRAA